MQAAFALDFERVAALNRMARINWDALIALSDQITQDPAKARRLIPSFIALCKDIREDFSDIAKEKGERRPVVTVEHELTTWAAALAQQQGYDVDEAHRVAALVAQGKLPLLPEPPSRVSSDSRNSSSVGSEHRGSGRFDDA